MSLPELPTDTDITVTGWVRNLNGRPIVILPYAAPTGPRRGRRFRVRGQYTAAVSRVVFSVGGQAALTAPTDAPMRAGELVTLRLHALPVRPKQRVPDDLRKALIQSGLDLNEFDESTVRHVLSMVAEAREPSIRSSRITAAVSAALSMRNAAQ